MRVVRWVFRNLPLLAVAGLALFLVLKWRGLEAENARLRNVADAGIVAEIAKRQAEDRHAISVIRSQRAPLLPEAAALRAEVARERVTREALERRLAEVEAASATLLASGSAAEVAASLRARGLASAAPARRPR